MWIFKKSFQFLQILHKYYDFICHKICSLTLTVTTKTGYYGSHEEWEYLSSETEEIFVKRKKKFSLCQNNKDQVSGKMRCKCHGLGNLRIFSLLSFLPLSHWSPT